MYENLPPLDWLRAFEASARLGTFTAAAEELSLTPSAVSHQIRALEGQLDQTLFDRHNKRLVLNRAGHDFQPVVAQALSALDIGTASIFGDRTRRVVTLRCLSSLASVWLLPRLPRFLAAHPGMSLTLLTATWSETREGRSIDLDIRYGDGRWSDGVVTPLLQSEVLPVCAPHLAADSLEALRHAPLIEMAGVTDTWRAFFREAGRAPLPVLTVDQSASALSLARAGVGHALLARVFAEGDLAAGTLVPSVPQSLVTEHGHYLVRTGKKETGRPDINALADWLLAEAAAG